MGSFAVVTTQVASQPLSRRTATYSTWSRTSYTLVTSSCCSARLEAVHPHGSPALPIPERAELRAAAWNLELGTPAISPSPTTCSFLALEPLLLGRLAKIAMDCAIVFRGKVAPPLVQIEAIRAREILDGRLAEARSRKQPQAERTFPPPNVGVGPSQPDHVGRGPRPHSLPHRYHARPKHFLSSGVKKPTDG
ncbi:hypothetical protein ZWY2020_042483 [Hordeum vulgare]|nr:hypothetical protein ZWY2020_042483 [Hordeum vulgare]